jgi:hypothetical protein
MQLKEHQTKDLAGYEEFVYVGYAPHELLF